MTGAHLDIQVRGQHLAWFRQLFHEFQSSSYELLDGTPVRTKRDMFYYILEQWVLADAEP